MCSAVWRVIVWRSGTDVWGRTEMAIEAVCESKDMDEAGGCVCLCCGGLMLPAAAAVWVRVWVRRRCWRERIMAVRWTSV